MRADRADVFFRVLDRPDRTADFVILLDLARVPDVALFHAKLESGFDRALDAHPKTKLVLAGKRWRTARQPREQIALLTGDTPADERLDELIAPPLDLEKPLVRQTLVVSPYRTTLVTRFHHALGDGASAFMFLETQLAHAFDREAPGPEQALVLKTHPAPWRATPYAFEAGSTTLCDPRAIGGHRRALVRSLDVSPLRRLVARNDRRFTYNDALLCATVEALRRWPGRPEGDFRPRVMLPMNVRESPFEGFGNGSTMVGVNARVDPQTSFEDRALALREQVKWLREHGAWARPKEGPVWKLAPFFLIRAVVKRVMASERGPQTTVCFTHLERQSSREWRELFPEVERAYIVSPLMAQQPLMICTVTQHDVANVCVTYNEQPCTRGAVETLCDLIESVVRELDAPEQAASEIKEAVAS